MQLSSIITTAGLLVASTNAFLIPPDVDISDEGLYNILPHPTGDDDLTGLGLGKEASLELGCPGCPIRKQHRTGKVETTTNIASHLELNFAIENVDGQDALTLNGYPLFPSALASPEDYLKARVVPEFKKPNHVFVQHNPEEPEILGFGIIARPVSVDPETRMELFAIGLQIIEVGKVFVDGINTVEAMLIMTPTGKLMLADVSVIEPETPVAISTPDADKCNSLLCQIKNMFKGVFAGFGSFRPCAGKRPEMAGEIVGEADEGFREGPPHPPAHPPHPPPPPPHGGPGHHPHGPHGHHGHPHGPGHHRLGHLLHSIFSQILLPIMFGIFAGVTASIIGMAAGTLLVHVWRSCVRAGGRCPRRRNAEDCNKASAEAVVADEEKAGLMDHQEEEIDAPPAYDNHADPK